MRGHGNSTWTRGEVAKLRAMRAKGYGFVAIGLVVGHSSASCAAKACELGIYKPKAEKPSAQTRSAQRVARKRAEKERWLQSVRAPASEAKQRASLRPCLSCERPFRSVGPHNRLCDRCRSGSLHRYDVPAVVGA